MQIDKQHCRCKCQAYDPRGKLLSSVPLVRDPARISKAITATSTAVIREGGNRNVNMVFSNLRKSFSALAYIHSLGTIFN